MSKELSVPDTVYYNSSPLRRFIDSITYCDELLNQVQCREQRAAGPHNVSKRRL